MAFMTKSDPFGLATTGLEVSDVTENQTISTAEARGENGFVVAVETFGQRKNPSANYAVTQNVTLSSIKLGGATADGSANKAILTSFSVSTSAGGAPTASASGTSVPNASILTGQCECTLPSIAISALHHAQLMGGITMSGTGCHLTASTLTASVDLSTAEVDGTVKAFDVTNGKMTFTGTIQSSDSSYAAPTITLPAGWNFTTPVTLTNPNADFPSYTFTAEKPLAADTAGV